MATQKFHHASGKITHLYRKIIHVNVRWTIVDKLALLRRFVRLIWERYLVCSARNMPHSHYRRLSTRRNSSAEAADSGEDHAAATTSSSSGRYDSDDDDDDSDLVSLKISILGDCETGKTTFVIKFVGDEGEKKSLQMRGLNLMDKTLRIRGARIGFRIWDVGGDGRSDQVPIACKDAVAILFMFDLTSRCTLNSVIGWYSEARKWNQNAIPILIGTKFDSFVQLPPDLQWAVVTQARAYAKAMKATLFFSSATHNINVNKIFKFIMAKLFNLPWTLQRNLTIGEPIIDF